MVEDAEAYRYHRLDLLSALIRLPALPLPGSGLRHRRSTDLSGPLRVRYSPTDLAGRFYRFPGICAALISAFRGTHRCGAISRSAAFVAWSASSPLSDLYRAK